MGLLLAFLLAFAALLGLWRFGRLDRAALQLAAAALCLALAGYASQGSPSIPGSPASKRADVRNETLFAQSRSAFFGQFYSGSQWLTISESFQRRGQTQEAVGILNAGIKAHPRDSSLWAGLGDALIVHTEGLMTPAAEFAFARAQQLAPGRPGPRFYYGLALAQNGRFEEAGKIWREILAEAPADAEWRPLVASRLVLLDRLTAALAAAERPPSGSPVAQ